MDNSPEVVAVHEAGHAVVGICLRGVGHLSYVKLDRIKGVGSCKWKSEFNGEQLIQVAIKFAGPVAQVVFAPHSVGPAVEELRESIVCESATHVRGWADDVDSLLYALENPGPNG